MEEFWVHEPTQLLRSPFQPWDSSQNTKKFNHISRVLFWGFLAVALIPWNSVNSLDIVLLGTLLLIVTAVLYFIAQPSGLSKMVASIEDDPFSIQECTLPTEHNPFMNLPMSHYGTGLIQAPACRGPHVRKMAEEAFQKRGPQDKRDLYGRKVNWSRAWVTLPRTGTFDNKDFFLRWLHGSVNDCKTNPLHCTQLNVPSDPQYRVV